MSADVAEAASKRIEAAGFGFLQVGLDLPIEARGLHRTSFIGE
jgi:hypothetical protein